MVQGPRETRTIETEIFGKHVSFPYSDTWTGYSLFLGRIVIGFVLLQAGLDKLLDPTWTAQAFLANVDAANPFRGFFVGMAGSAILDQLVQWGLALTGLGLILGAVTRWCAFWGSFIMLMFWAASLQGGLTQGLPIEHGFVISQHIVYILLMFALAAFGAGRVLGVDAWLEDSRFVRENAWLRFVLG